MLNVSLFIQCINKGTSVAQYIHLKVWHPNLKHDVKRKVRVERETKTHYTVFIVQLSQLFVSRSCILRGTFSWSYNYDSFNATGQVLHLL